MASFRMMVRLAAMTAVVFAQVVRAAVPAVVDDAAGLRHFAATEAARARAPRIPREVFLARSMLRSARLSPDGAHVAALVEVDGTRSVWLASATQPQGRRLLERTTATKLLWSRDGRWLFLVSPNQLYAQAMGGQRGSGAVAALGGASRRDFAAVDPWMEAAVLLIERPPRGSHLPRRWRLWRARPGAADELLHESSQEIVDFAFAPDGRLTHLSLAEGDGHTVLRRDEDDRWTHLVRCRQVEHCVLLTTADRGRDLMMISDHGSDLRRLVRVAPDGSARTLHLDPRGEADLDEVLLDPSDNRPRIAAYRSTVAHIEGLDEEAQAAVARIQSRFPGRDLHLELSRGRHWLVHERGAELHGEQVHLVDPLTGHSVELFGQLAFDRKGKATPRLSEAQTARQVAVAWEASDGMRLYGHLVLPPGVDPARAPLLVSVHGGPWNHVGPEWSTQVQFLANRGYVIFSPNFRGSTGHGRQYLFAAQGDFGGNGRVLGDLLEGARWLLSHGIGDPERVGMVGASFGGYATLLGLTFAPELFKVGIAAVPPTDFGRQLREATDSKQEFVKGVPLAVSLRDLGADPADAQLTERLSEQSPLAHAAAMNRPLVIFAGGEDDRIPIRAVTHYAAQLSLRKKDVTLFVDADSGHNNPDPRTAEAALYLQETLLHRVFGGEGPAPANPALRGHLERNLRLTGATLRN